MAHPAWAGVTPALPTSPVFGSFRRGFASRFTEFPSDRGPAPRRARFAAASREEAFDLYMTEAQEAALRTFYEVTLAGGALPFTIFNPTGGAARLARFAAEPAAAFHGPGVRIVSISLEVLPA